ncbi:MAG: GAF domain-containing sensor histidine kinase [Pseudomonadota bacterium]
MDHPVLQRIRAFIYEIGRDEPLAKEKWWILLRWVLLGVVVLVTVIGNRFIHLNIPASKVFFLSAIAFLFNAFLYFHISAIEKRPARQYSSPPVWFTYSQFAVDWAFVSLTFHYTGGIASPLLFYFLFHVILGGVLLEKRARVFYLNLIALTVNGLALLELGGFVPHIYVSSFVSRDVQDHIFFVLILLFLFDAVLYLSSSFVILSLRHLREKVFTLAGIQYKLEQDNRDLRLLNQLTKGISLTLGLHPRLDFICQTIMDVMAVKGVAIRLLEEKVNRLELVCSRGLSETYINKGPVESDRSLAKALQGEPHFVLDASTDPAVQYPEEARKEGIVSMLSFPLKGRDKVLGTLRLYTSQRRQFSQYEQDFISALASQAAISIENARIYDALDRQDKAKSDFIMMMTHELKGPLMAIHGLLEVMLKGYVGSLSDKQQELIRRVYRRIESVMEVSTGLLDIYQWQSKDADIKWVPLSVKKQIQRVVELFRESAKEKGLSLDVELPDEDLTLIGTEDDMEKILNNLVTNSIKYTPKGGKITISASASEDQILITVNDTGIGIDAKDMPRIFDQFFRSDEAKAIDPYGKGLGLPFVKKVVETLGGTIRVKSNKGEGAEFTITFPSHNP